MLQIQFNVYFEWKSFAFLVFFFFWLTQFISECSTSKDSRMKADVSGNDDESTERPVINNPGLVQIDHFSSLLTYNKHSEQL